MIHISLPTSCVKIAYKALASWVLFNGSNCKNHGNIINGFMLICVKSKNIIISNKYNMCNNIVLVFLQEYIITA